MEKPRASGDDPPPATSSLTVIQNDAARQTDADLVTAARDQGNTASDAFAELVRRYQRMAYALALSLVQVADADDVVQDAFLRAFRNLDLLADPAKFAVWLRRITFGVAIDHVRARRSRASVVGHADLDATNEFPTVAIDVADPGPSPLQQVVQGEVVRRVLDAMDRMPARYRVPLSLYHIDGLTHAKVASTLGVPEGTVRSLVARARRKLALLLASSPEALDVTDNSAPIRAAEDVLDDKAAPPPRFLHVLNGDSVRVTLEHSDVPGAFAVYAEVFHEGPVLREIGTNAARETRARYHSARGYVPYADAMRFGETWDGRLEAYADYDEVVLWFEHDLFDQLLLVHHLAWFAGRTLGRTALSLICIGEFPGFEPFHGLGQLNPDQLTSLLGTREPVSNDQIALGVRGWEAFTSSDPIALDALVHDERARFLPFLAGALQRFVEEYPALSTGLPRTERHILELLADGPTTPERLFVAEQRCEERVFMGDTTFWLRISDLARGAHPLVSLDVAEPEEDRVFPRGTVRITDVGRDVLAGRADWVHLNGFDRWLGGVHLEALPGGDVSWRYDVRTGRIVPTRGQSTRSSST
jgi:RNA polymerase sigma factor (sigma-70 family)